MLPQTLTEVRQAIDGLDAELIALLAKRQTLVEQAGRLKPRGDAKAVAAPDRVAQVIAAADRPLPQGCRPMWPKPCGRR